MFAHPAVDSLSIDSFIESCRNLDPGEGGIAAEALEVVRPALVLVVGVKVAWEMAATRCQTNLRRGRVVCTLFIF